MKEFNFILLTGFALLLIAHALSPESAVSDRDKQNMYRNIVPRYHGKPEYCRLNGYKYNEIFGLCHK